MFYHFSATLTLHHQQNVLLDPDKITGLENLTQEASDLENQCLKGGSVAKQNVDEFCRQAAKSSEHASVKDNLNLESTIKEETTQPPESCGKCECAEKHDICDSSKSFKDDSISGHHDSSCIQSDQKEEMNSESRSETQELRTKVELIKEKFAAILSG